MINNKTIKHKRIIGKIQRVKIQNKDTEKSMIQGLFNES